MSIVLPFRLVNCPPQGVCCKARSLLEISELPALCTAEALLVLQVLGQLVYKPLDFGYVITNLVRPTMNEDGKVECFSLIHSTQTKPWGQTLVKKGLSVAGLGEVSL